ncbi:uncharacterized protein BX664DRAFT_335494 [Halteromyces radiatus]|uniref:uncharacterized protein n=1 Tax=Halteromyces radiatus TaxID=101107 RepID=UPI00221F98DD|nr:uncharacterized protein BX664DRAFT_335494 [Halteromyces radiatus]KAI8086310.1 hypothetical protein BX664DRAFT_335494 [Halteromyces radiatus]
MHQEITEAIDFIGRLLQSKLEPSLITLFKAKLYELLSERFLEHWDPEHPGRGNAYRAITIFNGQLDALLTLAAQQVSISPNTLLVHLPQEFVLWIDPSAVSYRVGDHGNIMDLFMDGKSLKDRKTIMNNVVSTSTPIRISPPTSPASNEKKLFIDSRPSSPLAIHAKKDQQQQQQQSSRHKSLVLAH